MYFKPAVSYSLYLYNLVQNGGAKVTSFFTFPKNIFKIFKVFFEGVCLLFYTVCFRTGVQR